MKKSKLLALSLASLVGLAGCGSSNPPAGDFAKQLEEEFVRAVFGQEAVAEIEEVKVDRAAGEGIAVFDDVFGSLFEYYYGTSLFGGYELWDFIFTPVNEASVYTALDFYEEYLQTEDWPAIPEEGVRASEEPGEEPGEVDPVDPEPAEPVPAAQFYDFVDNCGLEYEVVWGPEYDTEINVADLLIFFYVLDETGTVAKEIYSFGFAAYDTVLDKEYVIEEAGQAQYDEWAAKYKTDESGNFPVVYFESGASKICGSKYSSEGVVDSLNLEYALADIPVVLEYDAEDDKYTGVDFVGAAKEGDDAEAALAAFVEGYASYLPEDFSLIMSEYGDGAEAGLDDGTHYFFAIYAPEDLSVFVSFLAGVYSGYLLAQISI